MSDYERIARVIRYLDEHGREQPDLATLAGVAGLSASRFHRLFARWAGVTPKDFLQALTLEHARRLLRQGRSVLDSALDAGLSGPGRLHDLCVTLEAATPGDIKSGGAAWTLEAGLAPTPFGAALIAVSPRGICHLGFVDDGGEEAGWRDLRASWPRAKVRRDDTRARQLARCIFANAPRHASSVPLRALAIGTAFQVRVWRALLRVPPRALVSYGWLAGQVDAPSAARAVGSAVGRNPLAWLIPCHRVIRATGLVRDYRWGATRKRAMVAWETA
jgi:AraC family transcriptional regulator of adaptative response/methylated-DNA-[protein]-cysteine methyltransferase